MDMEVECARDANQITIRLVMSADQQPDTIQMWVRVPRQLLSVTRNGSRLATFDPASGLIRFQADQEKNEIAITY
jgi:hypothetical protein